MSRKPAPLLHLTIDNSSNAKVAVRAKAITCISERVVGVGCVVSLDKSEDGFLVVREPYDQVLRIWADLLSSE